MKSSPSSAASSLDLPAALAAQAASAGLLVAAGLFAAWALQRHGLPWLVAIAAGAGLLAGLIQARAWRRARCRPSTRLRPAPDGTLWLDGDAGAVAVRVGPATRLLGPSVFLELRGIDTEARYRGWLTALDLPSGALRRLILVLPRSGADGGS